MTRKFSLFVEFCDHTPLYGELVEIRVGNNIQRASRDS